MEENKKLISVVIPCYNEEENVQAMTDTVTRIIASELPEYDYEIIFIDNHSQDGTKRIIRHICEEDRHVKAIFNARNFE
jgi:glycosyltransferase involved in cell wall biosynthesis